MSKRRTVLRNPRGEEPEHAPHLRAMAILVLTIFLSVLFAIGFTVAFVATLAKSPARSMEQQSLLPLADDTSSTPHS